MKVAASSLKYEPGVTLYLVPETDVERVLLRDLWSHGRLELTNGVADRSGQGYAITACRKDSIEPTQSPAR
jgi:hypothetical protein